jgi:hypothetical protein
MRKDMPDSQRHSTSREDESRPLHSLESANSGWGLQVADCHFISVASQTGKVRFPGGRAGFAQSISVD